VPAVDNIWLSVVAPPGAASANLLGPRRGAGRSGLNHRSPFRPRFEYHPAGQQFAGFPAVGALNQIAEKRYPHDGIGLRAGAFIADWVADTFAELTPGT